MNFEDFKEQYRIRETDGDKQDAFVAGQVLEQFLKITNKKDLLIDIGDELDTLVTLCFKSKGTEYENTLYELLHEYNYNFSLSIRNAIYYLLANRKDYNEHIRPELWPGVNGIDIISSKYKLYTMIGDVEVYRASSMFSGPSRKMFSKNLMRLCHERSLEFLKKNRDYKVILSCMPNFFCGESYHSYLENGDQVLDIAANAFYESHEYADKILCGRKLAELTYDEVVSEFESLKSAIPKLPNKHKLLSLSIYHDIITNKDVN